MNEYHTSTPTTSPSKGGEGAQRGGGPNPPSLIGGFPIKILTPVFSVDKITLVGNLHHRTEKAVHRWSASLDLLEPTFAPYPYKHAMKTVSGVYFAFRSPEAKDIPDVRIEFNPNHFSSPPEVITSLVALLRSTRLTRLDLAIDYGIDLSSYHYSTDVPKAGAIYYGRNQCPETFYLGRRSAGSMYRIYDKAREQKLTDVTWWRIEQELHLRPKESWREKNPFGDLHVTKPSWVLGLVDRAVLEELKRNPQGWSELTPHLKRKYKKLMSEEQEVYTLQPAPRDIFKSESWKVDAVLNTYQKLMIQGGADDEHSEASF